LKTTRKRSKNCGLKKKHNPSFSRRREDLIGGRGKHAFILRGTRFNRSSERKKNKKGASGPGAKSWRQKRPVLGKDLFQSPSNNGGLKVKVRSLGEKKHGEKLA